LGREVKQRSGISAGTREKDFIANISKQKETFINGLFISMLWH